MSLSNFSFSSRHTKCCRHWSNHERPMGGSQEAQTPISEMLSHLPWLWLGDGSYLGQIQLLQLPIALSIPCSRLDPRTDEISVWDVLCPFQGKLNPSAWFMQRESWTENQEFTFLALPFTLVVLVSSPSLFSDHTTFGQGMLPTLCIYNP